jgi:aldehyde dehydrogenase (NAD+)
MTAVLKNSIGGEWSDGTGICTNINPSDADGVVGEYAKADRVLKQVVAVDHPEACGGRKGSSYGAREQVAYAREFYTTARTAYTV